MRIYAWCILQIVEIDKSCATAKLYRPLLYTQLAYFGYTHG